MAKIHHLNTINIGLFKPISIKKDKIDSVIELTETINEEVFFVPNWQKEVVCNRVAHSKDSDFTSLDDVIKKLKFD